MARSRTGVCPGLLPPMAHIEAAMQKVRWEGNAVELQVRINRIQQRGLTAAILLTVAVIPTKKKVRILKVWLSVIS